MSGDTGGGALLNHDLAVYFLYKKTPALTGGSPTTALFQR